MTRRYLTWGASAAVLAMVGGYCFGAQLAQAHPQTLVAQVSTVAAPLGNYEATLGGTVATTRVSGELGGGRLTRGTAVGAGLPVSINLANYNTLTELQTLGLKARTGDLASSIAAYNNGSITIGNRVYPINLAVSYQRGANYIVHLSSTQSFALERSSEQVSSGAGLGYIRLEVPVDGSVGQGQLYTSAQVRVSEDGVVSLGRGLSTATELLDITFSGEPQGQ